MWEEKMAFAALGQALPNSVEKWVKICANFCANFWDEAFCY